MAVLCLSVVARGQTDDFPPPSNLGDPDHLGRGIQRTMTLLASSTPERRNTVRILLYGQSITAGPWGGALENHLRETFPHADLIYSRRPLSGFSTERLVKTSRADLYPAQADLVIFHDYGNHDDYETMLRELRSQTTSEVIIQADHVRRSEQVINETEPSGIADRRQRWAAERNYQFLPEMARKYGCAFDHRRDLWKAYLREHDLQPGQLVKDDVHPNEHGTYLMTELIKAYLVDRDDVDLDPMNCGYVSTFDVGTQIKSEGNQLKFDFDGNRIDVIFDDSAVRSLQATIDGRVPLADPSMLYHSRNRVKWRDTPIPPGPWPAVLKMSFETPLLVEDWTLEADQDSADSELYRFRVTGSQSGFDGEGRTDQRFVSHSGRVVIEPDDWDVAFSIVALRRLKALPEEFQLDWSVLAQATNEVTPPASTPGTERAVRVAAGLTDGRHRLQLTGDLSGIRAIRVYSPAKFPCPFNRDR